MITAVIRRFHSPDVDPLDAFVGPVDEPFAVLVQMMIGPRESEGEESFDVLVCSPSWIARQCDDRPFLLEHMVCVPTFDWSSIRELLEQRVSTVSGATWQDVAQQLGRIGRWEFSDYQSG